MAQDAARDEAAPVLHCDVLTLGEAMVLFAAEQTGPLAQVAQFRRYAAGAELNVAIGLSRLGHSVAYLSRLGGDSFGRYLLDTMQAENITTKMVRQVPGQRTGFMLKGRTIEGDPEIEYHRSGSAASQMGPEDAAPLATLRARHLHLTGISPALSPGCHALVLQTLRWARAQGMVVSFDPNVRLRLWPSAAQMSATLNALAAECDLVLPGIEEGRLLTGHHDAQAVAQHYLQAGARQVVVKLGPEGAWCADRQGLQRQVPGQPVAKVVDTVGAGDGFAVGVISGLLDGLPLPEATRRGNRIGARVVQFPGDSDGLPRRHELDEAP